MDARRIMVALSGGVDSSVVAAWLLSQGHQVEGITMRTWRQEDSSTATDLADAATICAHLGIPHHVVDLRQAFHDEVVSYFVREYACGRTPNPCLPCNRLIKFGLLRREALRLGASWMATGHYVRLRHVQDEWQLWRGVDTGKDQSYFLYSLDQEQLATTLFPLGEWTKERTREYASQLGLPCRERPESQDICFVAEGDYRRFLQESCPDVIKPGPIVDMEGRVLGEHKGLPYYTIGQRGGLGISAPYPLYVIQMDVQTNQLMVAYSRDLGRDTLYASEMSYISGCPVDSGYRVAAKIRYRARLAPAAIWPLPDGRARIHLDSALRDITPGQAVVLYGGDRLLGGGIIESAQIQEPAHC